MATSTPLVDRYPSFKDLTFGVEYEFLAHIDVAKLSEAQKMALDPDAAPPRHVVRLMSEAIKEELNKCGLQQGVEVTDMIKPLFGDKDTVNERA